VTYEAKFNSIRKRVLAASERIDAHEDALRRKYGQTRPPAAWLTRTEDRKRETLYAAQSKAWDDMFDLLDIISPRQWRSGIAAAWVAEHLTYEDATTTGPLSVVPTPGYGSTQRSVEQFAEAVAA
jgi:hypothetical protein